MHLAALVSGPGEGASQRVAQTGVLVADDVPYPAQPPAEQILKDPAPGALALRAAEPDPQMLPVAVLTHAHHPEYGSGAHPAVAADLLIVRINHQVRIRRVIQAPLPPRHQLNIQLLDEC